MRIIVVVFSFLFSMQSTCLSQMRPEKREIQDYQKIISLYPSDLVAGFPKAIKNRMYLFMDLIFPRGKYMSYIHLGLSLDDKEIRSLEMRLMTEAKGIYAITDSCLMVIPYNYENFKIIESDTLKNCIAPRTLPVSNFKNWDVYFPPEFLKDAKIYLLDAKQGRFLEDDNLPISGVGLPKEWLHGYTKGVAILKNDAMYWLEIW